MRTVRLLPLDPAPFSLQLALSDAAPPEDPFVRLSAEEDFGRVLLGAIRGDSDSIVELCAVKLLRNAFPSSDQYDVGGLANPAVAERWREEADRIRQLRGTARYFPRLFAPDPAAVPRWLPPLLYCRSGERFFTPPCPRCGAPLSTCRDDALLSKRGLPLYSASLDRFLYCAACAEGEEEEGIFYAYQVPAEGAPESVRPASDLFRDLGEALARKLLDGFPCEECREAAGRVATSTRPFWEERWVALTFYDSPYLVTGLARHDLDRFADTLGGRRDEAEAVGRPAVPAGLTSAQDPQLSEEDPAGPRERFLFDAQSSGLDALEVFFLKLAAFRQVARGVLEYHRAFGRPHLDLHPRHVLFDLSRAGDSFPLLWGFQARIHGMASAARVETLAGEANVVVPPRNPTVPYAAPEILEFHLNPSRPAQLVVQELEEVPTSREQAKRWRLHGRLSDPYGIFPAPLPHDWILIAIDNEALGLAGVRMAARVDPREAPADAPSQEARFISEPVTLEETAAARLRRTAGVKVPGARYKVYPDFNAPSDLFSLGMILLRMLVGNDRQDARGIAGIVEKVTRRLMTAGDTTIDHVRSGPGASALIDRDPDLLTALKKANVFHQEIDRGPERPNAIPDLLWKRAILLGLRLATRVGGFSTCADAADYDPAHPTEKLEQLHQEADLLACEVRALLLDRQAIHIEIQNVLAELAAEKALEDTGRRAT